MPRRSTPSFVAEFPLRTTAADEATLDKRLHATQQVYNASLGESLKRLRLMRESKDWQRARAMPTALGHDAKSKPIPNKERALLFKATAERFGFTSAAIQKYAETCRDACWVGGHLGSHDTQTASLRAFRAAQAYAFGIRGRPRFKAKGRLRSIEGKGDAVLRYRTDPVPAVLYSGLSMPLRLDPRDKHGWQGAALAARTKYVRIIRRCIRGRMRWYAQLVQEGEAPLIRETREGVVGLDIGPSTMAAVSDQDAVLERFCPGVTQPWKALRRLERAMDRSRRASNPENYRKNGTVRPGPKRWLRSERYKRIQRQRAEIERRLASERRRAHGELANRVLGQGTTVKSEDISYKSFQKNFGRSTKVRAAGSFMREVKRKAARAGGGILDIRTRTTRLSQFDHSTGQYVKKPLSQRIHAFGDGVTEPVQRDLYSAFLATCCDADALDICQVHRTWPTAELLLRQAMSEIHNRRAGKASPFPASARTPEPVACRRGLAAYARPGML